MNYAITRDRRTNADIAFDYLEDEILSLRLKPGTKISEAEIAARLGLSRQPVREAFARLQLADLLHVQPQRATTVRKFSLERIAASRFVRRAIEMEVLHQAVAQWDGSLGDAFDTNLKDQQAAVATRDLTAFQRCDLAFHASLCQAAGAAYAMDEINALKAKTNRLCVLSLGREQEMDDLLDDHTQIYEAICAGDHDAGAEVMRRHLSRLDDTVAEIHRKHADYFEA